MSTGLTQIKKINTPTLKNISILEAKKKLAATDYKAIKFAEGELTSAEYAPIREERRALRARIRALETELMTLEG